MTKIINLYNHPKWTEKADTPHLPSENEAYKFKFTMQYLKQLEEDLEYEAFRVYQTYRRTEDD